jgi:hypothetical protein
MMAAGSRLRLRIVTAGWLAGAAFLAGCGGQVQTIISNVGEPIVAPRPVEGMMPGCGSLDTQVCDDAVESALAAIGAHGPLAAIVADSTCPPNARCSEVDLIVAFLSTGGSTAAVTIDWDEAGEVGAVTSVDLGPDATMPDHVLEQLRP